VYRKQFPWAQCPVSCPAFLTLSWKKDQTLHSIFSAISPVCTEDEDSEGPGSGENHQQHSPNQSYLCIPFPRGEDGDGPSSDGVHEEPTPVNSATSTPQLTPTNSLKRGGTHHRRCEVALLGCGAVLAATGLGFDLLEAGKCQLLPPEEPEPPAREEKKRREGLFQRASRPRRSTSPPSRKLFKKEEPMTLLGDPSASLTLLSLSSISECNSTRSLLRSDSDEIVVYEMPVSPVEAPPLTQCTHNPLVNVRVERFKRDPNQSLTPTHVTLTAPTQPSGHRRTPSDGALKPTAAPAVLGSRSPSSNGMSPSPGTGEFWPLPLFSLLLLWPPGVKMFVGGSFSLLLLLDSNKLQFFFSCSTMQEI
jgi:mitogen-activated protein kinase kinase kinase 9